MNSSPKIFKRIELEPEVIRLDWIRLHPSEKKTSGLLKSKKEIKVYFLFALINIVGQIYINPIFRPNANVES